MMKKYISFSLFLLMVILAGESSGQTEPVSIETYKNDFSLAITSLPADRENVLIVDRPCIAGANVIVPEGIRTIVKKGGLIRHGTNTLRFNGPIEADDYEVFSGTGSVHIRSNSIIRLEWFGGSPAKNPELNDLQFTRGLNAVPDQGNCTVSLNTPGTYLLNTGLEMKTGNVRMNFGEGVLFKSLAGTGLHIYGKGIEERISDITVKNFNFEGGEKTQHGIVAMYCERVVLENCRIRNVGTNGISIGGYGVNTSLNCKIMDCDIAGFGAFGIISTGTRGLEVARCRVTGCRELRKCASAIQMKNSEAFNLHHNFTDGGEHGINIRCSSKGGDTTGICTYNEVRNAVKIGIYAHHETSDGLTGELREVVIAHNRIYSPGWFFLEISAAEGHRTTDMTVTDNIGLTAGTTGMTFTNVNKMFWKNNRLQGIRGRGIFLSEVHDSIFTGGLIETTAATSYPVVVVRNSTGNLFEKISLAQEESERPCISEEAGSKNNIFSDIDSADCRRKFPPSPVLRKPYR